MTKALKIIKLNNIAERLEAASKPSTSTTEMISEVLKILEPWCISSRIIESKPSTSSSQITTMEMVRFVNTLLDYVQDHGPREFFNNLRPLQAIFTLTASRCIEHESMRHFFIHVENVAYTALEILFRTIITSYEISQWQDWAGAFNHRQILTALKSSRSETTLKSGCMVDFVNALRRLFSINSKLFSFIMSKIQ
ncbi:hypothetical protein KY290_024471 [Solanum tuberosum]|uniref:Uncharacterized protein n=1 Tax=Solanum tuberosum TaxID=4113 RepID=A0ABQ7UQR8_SOLTU|nr:hypothetical protein KY290_024471 [Solanum tuberosum]